MEHSLLDGVYDLKGLLCDAVNWTQGTGFMT